ncbi:MAG: hypothetical protein J3R72DRAFT_445148 [Linnemannia gamsii]|nr:MAG: hypothetical protein J3R72DRAFT_445148 [Linnemannia gamsii]
MMTYRHSRMTLLWWTLIHPQPPQLQQPTPQLLPQPQWPLTHSYPTQRHLDRSQRPPSTTLHLTCVTTHQQLTLVTK